MEREAEMSLRPEAIGPVPDETARVAHAVFPGGRRRGVWCEYEADNALIPRTCLRPCPSHVVRRS